MAFLCPMVVVDKQVLSSVHFSFEPNNSHSSTCTVYQMQTLHRNVSSFLCPSLVRLTMTCVRIQSVWCRLLLYHDPAALETNIKLTICLDTHRVSPESSSTGQTLFIVVENEMILSVSFICLVFFPSSSEVQRPLLLLFVLLLVIADK